MIKHGLLQSISPGYVNTEMPKQAGLDALFSKKLPALEAEDVAQAILFALATPPHVQVSLLQTIVNDFYLFICLLLQIHDIIIKPVGECC